MIGIDLQHGNGALETPGLFRKLHGAGNDFILITVDEELLASDWSGTASRLCDRRTGIGGGLVLIARSGDDRFTVVTVNADGSTASMCGNALRCVAYAASLDFGLTAMTLSIAGREHRATATPDGAAVTADLGSLVLDQLPVLWRGRTLSFDAVHTGTEHVVTFVDDLDRIDVGVCGAHVRHHPGLAPVGANVNFVLPTGPNVLRIRTFERGVEAETLSCGSGAVAVVAIAGARGLVRAEDGPVVVHNQAGAPLVVRPDADHPGIRFWVGGPVSLVYQGALEGASA